VRLTPAGEMLLAGAPTLLRGASLLRDELGRQARTQVSIGLPFSMHRMVTAPFAAREIRNNPAVSLRVYEGFVHHLRQYMQQGLIDAAVMDFQEVPGAGVEQTPLLREHLLLVGPPGADLDPTRRIAPEQVGASPLILPGRPNAVRLSVDAYLKRHGQKYRRAADAETLALCLSLVKEGLGYTVMPYCALHDDPQLAQLARAPIQGLAITWSLYVSSARRHTAGVRSVSSSLASEVQRLVASGKWSFAEAVGVTRR
jgi:LysR family nitrogen assimilation transcriptional regulator